MAVVAVHPEIPPKTNGLATSQTDESPINIFEKIIYFNSLLIAACAICR
jgi:hypothetical protein